MDLVHIIESDSLDQNVDKFERGSGLQSQCSLNFTTIVNLKSKCRMLQTDL